MKRIVLAAIIVVSLITLSSSFVPEHDPPNESFGHVMQGYLSKLPSPLRSSATPNEPISQTVTPTLTPTYTGHIPVTAHEADNRKGAQEETNCSDKIIASVQEIVSSLLGHTQNMFDKARTEVVPVVGSSAQNVFNGVCTTVASIVDTIKHISAPVILVKPDRSKPVIYDANLDSNASRLGLISDPSLGVSERYSPINGQIYTINRTRPWSR